MSRNGKTRSKQPIMDASSIFTNSFSQELRTIYLLSTQTDAEGNESGIDPSLVKNVCIALDVLESESTKRSVNFVMSLPGGVWDSALAIYDRIRNSPCPTSMEVYGNAYSGAPIILQAADKRIMSPNATLLIHDGSISAPNGDENTRDLEAWGRFSSIVERPRMYEILAQRSKYTVKQWKEFCKQDFYLTAKKARAYGLVDEILESESSMNGNRRRFEIQTSKRKR